MAQINRKIKIAHVITRLIRGGAQRFCLDAIEHLDPAAYEVTLISGEETGGEGSFWDEVEEKQISSIKVPSLVRNISPLKDLSALIALYGLFRRGAFDIIHVHTSKAGALGILAARMAGIRAIVYSVQGHIFNPRSAIPGLSRILLKPLLLFSKVIYALSYKMIALTPSDRIEQVQLGLAPDRKFEVIYNPIDLKRFNPALYKRDEIRRQLGLRTEDSPVIITVARLTAEKGVEYLVKAAPQILKSQPGAKILIAGDGPEKGALVNMAAALNVKEAVRFLGYRRDIPELLTASDIYVLPSLYEGQGIVLAEAMAMGAAVVASRVGGVPGIVNDGSDGILTAPGDEKEIAQAVIRLAQDTAMKKSMVEKGRKKCEMFSMENMTRSLTALYRSALSQSGGRS